MAYNTVIQQGFFTSDGNAKILNVRSGVDWIETFNYSSAATPVNDAGLTFKWQLGMPQGSALYTHYTGAQPITATGVILAGGFTLIDTSLNVPGAATALTVITNATPPVVTVASTAGLPTGSIVRLTRLTGAGNLAGLDFTIENLSGTTFSLRNMVAPGTAATAGFYSFIPYDPLFYPARRVISRIAANGTIAAYTNIETTVDSQYQVGQQVRFSIPAIVGIPTMTQLDGLVANIVAVTPATPGNPSSFTVDIDTSTFTAFAFPPVASLPFTPPTVFPFGALTSTAVNQLTGMPGNPELFTDATINTGIIGVKLGAGTTLTPGGAAGNIIYWMAGKSFNT